MGSQLDLIMIDDHALLRDSLALNLQENSEFKIVQCFGDGEGALEFLDEHSAAMAIVDIRLPGIDGIETTRRMLRKRPDLKVVILSMFDQEWRITEALEAGAVAYLTKDVSVDELLFALKTVQGGNIFISPPLIKELLTHVSSQRRSLPMRCRLSSDLMILLKFASEGMSNKQIASSLGLPLAQIKHKFGQILKILDARDRTHAVAKALKQGLISLEE